MFGTMRGRRFGCSVRTDSDSHPRITGVVTGASRDSRAEMLERANKLWMPKPPKQPNHCPQLLAGGGQKALPHLSSGPPTPEAGEAGPSSRPPSQSSAAPRSFSESKLLRERFGSMSVSMMTNSIELKLGYCLRHLDSNAVLLKGP